MLLKEPKIVFGGLGLGQGSQRFTSTGGGSPNSESDEYLYFLIDRFDFKHTRLDCRGHVVYLKYIQHEQYIVLFLDTPRWRPRHCSPIFFRFFHVKIGRYSLYVTEDLSLMLLKI